MNSKTTINEEEEEEDVYLLSLREDRSDTFTWRRAVKPLILDCKNRPTAIDPDHRASAVQTRTAMLTTTPLPIHWV